MLELKKATKEKCKLRMILVGVPGAGKTYSALSVATALVPGGKILVLDSEYGSANKYADIFDFYAEQVTDHDPRNYIKLIKEAGQLGVDVLVIDSLSHAWQALLDLVTKEGAKSKSPFGGWDKGTPIQRELVEAILASKCHVIATARQKSEHVIAPNHNGKMTPTKVGMKSEQKADIEFEFDVAGELDTDNSLKITKTRCSAINGKSFHKPGKELADTLRGWLDAGVAPKSATGESGSTKSSAAPAQDPAAKKQEDAKPSEQPASSAANTTANALPGNGDPKPAPAGSSGGQSTASQKDAGATPGATAVGKEQMQQLLAVATDNGWDRGAISSFVCHVFKLDPKTFAQTITWKQWETAVKIVGRPENKGGKVTVDATGKPLPEAHRWPKAAA